MLLTLALVTQHATGSLSYSEARALAGEHRSHLTTEQIALVQQKFTEAMRPALPKCIATARPTESTEASVVLSLGSDGKVDGSWVEQNGAFAKCIEEALVGTTYIPAPSQPFYVSFDINLGIKRSAP
jgi:hypothetical protein